MNERYVEISYPNVTKYYSYEFLLENEKGQGILKTVYKNGYPVHCVCNGKYKKIKMSIAEYSSRYRIRTYPNVEIKHSTKCTRFNADIDTPKMNTNYKNKKVKFINEDKSDIQYAILNARGFKDKLVQSSPSSGHKGKTTYTHNQYTSLFTTGEILLSLAWNNYLSKKGKVPYETNIFFEIFNDIYNNSKINEDIGLNKIMYRPSYNINSDTDITEHMRKACYSIYMRGVGSHLKGYYMYVLGKVLDDSKSENGVLELKVEFPIKRNGNPYFILYIDEKKYKKMVKQHKIKYTNDVSKYISAYIHLSDNKLNIESMSIIPVLSGRGCFVDSSKEVDFAKMLLKKKRLFKKPCKSSLTSKFNNYIPDFLILDKDTNDFTIIAEVFGFYSEEYLIKEKEKISYYNSLDKYKFICWKANEGKPMPKIAEGNKE